MSGWPPPPTQLRGSNGDWSGLGFLNLVLRNDNCGEIPKMLFLFVSLQNYLKGYQLMFWPASIIHHHSPLVSDDKDQTRGNLKRGDLKKA